MGISPQFQKKGPILFLSPLFFVSLEFDHPIMSFILRQDLNETQRPWSMGGGH